ncbi:aminopeptidase N [Zootermopsis nevadensis]|uniref:aminopeptidase N n=1 Tax=Zootermopsis nevadensis TaxID=136037 RepID=UPI000B8E2F5B|nr:aminopeptidase N [Zootermopsis nevadensis]
MTQSREALAMMDGTTVTFSKRQGYVLSRWGIALIAALFLTAIVATGLLVYKFASCTQNEHGGACAKDGVQNGRASVPVLPTEPGVAPPAAPSDAPKLDVRLPRAVKPDSYKIEIIPFIHEGNFTFSGKVSVVVNATEPTSNITLHFNDIKIYEDSVTVEEHESVADGSHRPAEGKHILVDRLSNDTARQFFIIHLGQPLSEGKQYRVSMSYLGHLNDMLQGFYRSSYIVNNQTRWIAATQFQPTDARRAFPCFDEPALKAKFQISIARPRNMTSVSNMPQERESEQMKDLPDYTWDHYGQSVPMSTYLVAFVVSDFDHMSDGNFSVWARHEAIQQAEYSLNIGPKILHYYEQYFGIPFPLPKMDMIALPDFAAGAMENWGLITYRETAMLYKQGVSTNSNKQSVATVVSHELAHQWFGNLVTPSWWTDLWLNEGFASYVEYLGVNAVEPSWKILEQFVIFDLQNVFALDALESSHQISIEVGHPDEINEIFDRISYGKGASIIRMMDHFLTTEVFKKGVTKYLNSRKFGSSTQNDLWEALTSQAHVDKVLDSSMSVKEIMDTWTLQTGFPVVIITRDYNTGTVHLKQERFLLRHKTENSTTASPPEGEGSTLWWIPITFTSVDNPDFNKTQPLFWMKATPTLTLPPLSAAPDQWVIFNVQETGFYRANYDLTNWRLLIEYLMDRDHFSQIGIINRAQLLDDALNLARAGLLDYATALDVTRYLANELEYLPWKAALNALAYIDSMLIKTGNYDKFKIYLLGLLENLYKHTGFTDNPNDPQLTVYKRVNILSWACSLGHEDCVRNSVLQFQNWRSSPDPDRSNPISANLKNVVYCTAISVGGQDEWDFAWQRYRKTNVGSEKDILLGALGCSRETWILSRYLDRAVSEKSGIRKQDAARVFAAVASNSVGQPLAYSFLRNKWFRVHEYLGSSLFTISNIVRSCTKRINSPFELSDLMQFASVHHHELGAATRAMEQSLEQAGANVKWMESNYEPIVKWLANVTAVAAS